MHSAVNSCATTTHERPTVGAGCGPQAGGRAWLLLLFFLPHSGGLGGGDDLVRDELRHDVVV
jgi:hypothetical protein